MTDIHSFSKPRRIHWERLLLNISVVATRLASLFDFIWSRKFFRYLRTLRPSRSSVLRLLDFAEE